MSKHIINYIKDKKNFVSEFKKNTKYMNNGRYSFDENLESLYNSKLKKVDSKKDIKLKTILKKYIGIILTRGLTVSGNMKKFKGDIFIRGNRRTGDPDLVIMDCTNEIVMRINSSETRYEQKLDIYRKNKEHYPIPKIIDTNSEELIIIEKLILKKPKAKWSNNNKKHVFKKALSFNKNHLKEMSNDKSYSFVNTEDVINDLYENDLTQEFIKKNIDLTDSIVGYEVPYTELHGDYCFNNILLEKNEKEVKVIDWEYEGSYSFIYDFFWLILSEAITNNDYTFLEGYFNGSYDEFLIEIFHCFNLSYSEDFRMQYLYYGMLDTFYSILLNNSTIDIQIRYLDFYNEILNHVSKFETITEKQSS